MVALAKNYCEIGIFRYFDILEKGKYFVKMDSKQHEEYFRIAAQTAVEKIYNLYHDEGSWRFVASKRDFSWPDSAWVNVRSRSSTEYSGYILKVSTTLTADLQTTVQHMLPHGYKKQWDFRSETVHLINNNLWIERNWSPAACCGHIAPREVIEAIAVQHYPSKQMYIIGGKSVDHKDFPPNDLVVRATSHCRGLVVQEDRDKPGKLKLTIFAEVDFAGAIPKCLSNASYHNSLRRYLLGLKSAVLRTGNLNSPNWPSV